MRRCSWFLPKNIAAKLKSYGVRRHQVSRRIARMNRRLEEEIGEQVTEKRGWHWALTSFTVGVWGEKNQEETDEKLNF